jgi:hypothetical protein
MKPQDKKMTNDTEAVDTQSNKGVDEHLHILLLYGLLIIVASLLIRSWVSACVKYYRRHRANQRDLQDVRHIVTEDGINIDPLQTPSSSGHHATTPPSTSAEIVPDKAVVFSPYYQPEKQASLSTILNTPPSERCVHFGLP